MPGVTQLSTGCMASILTGVDVDKPVLQILGTKKIAGGEGNERYRLLVSDGKYLNSFAMLATQLNHHHADGNLVEFTIIRLDRYTTSMVNKSEKGEKRVLIILELTVLNNGETVGKKIGEPVQFTGEAGKTGGSAAPAPKPLAQSNYNKPSQSSNGGNTNYNNNTLNQSINSSLTHPISSLSPYQNRWVIKARVMSKSAIRTWSNAKGEGKLFSMDLIDESGEIRATAFKDQVDKFYDMLEADKVYFISKCQLKPANKQFSSLKNDYEMTFTNETVVQACLEDDSSSIPQMQYELIPISQIANIEEKAVIDVIGICRDINEVQTFNAKTTNKEYKKRDITLIDASNAAVSVTLWGDEAVNFEGHVQPVVLLKGARVSEFNGGKSLSMGGSAVMKINPDVPEGHKLRGWFDNGGGENITSSISTRTGGGGSYNTEWLTFHEARAKNLGNGDKPDYFQSKAVVHIIKSQNAVYKACAQGDCNKKVVDDGNQCYRCEKCNISSPEFKYRLLLNMSIGDWTSNRWVACFNEVAEAIIGKTAKEIGEALSEGDEVAAEEIFAPINFQSFIFKLRTKVEFFGDMHRNKISAVNVTPINYHEYNKHLITNLQALTGIGKN